jgi:hypothetical protein
MTPAEKKALWASVGVTAVGAVSYAYYQVRLYMRDEIERTFNEEYKYDRMIGAAKTAFALVGKDVKLPSARNFANAMVPLLGLNTPYDSIDDILAKGRKSQYWPPKFKEGGVSATFEPYVLSAMRGAYNTPEEATNAEMAAASAKAVVDAVVGGAGKKPGKKKGKKK